MRFVAAFIVLSVSSVLVEQAAAAIVPQGGQAQVVLTRIDPTGPDAGVERTVANSGAQPIGVFPVITPFGPIADPSASSGALAQLGIGTGSNGDQPFVNTTALLAQPPTARAENRLRLDFATAYTSAGATPAQDVNFAYPIILSVLPSVDPTDPAPFADFAAVVAFAVNGIAVPDTATLGLVQNGATAGPVAGLVTGPDATIALPALNDGDVLTMLGTLVFRTNSAIITLVPVPEPSAVVGACLLVGALLSRRTRFGRRG